jgi:phosphatidylserine/phosphatidylglycerophosphate/cardiolipin synthase-like enzyme
VASYQKSIFVDDEVASQVIDIVREAQQYATIITPYFKLWRHAQRALELAAEKGVHVTVIVRSKDGVPENAHDIPWLLTNGMQVRCIEYLHAKIYLNEHAVMLSSMNFYDFSTNNSLEIGLVVQDEQAARQVRDYVTNTLMRLAKPVSAPQTERRQQPMNRPAQPEPRPRPTTTHAQSIQQTAAGTCIRCGGHLFPDLNKPLCDDCYDKWAQYENEDYAERFCHICGRPWETSYAKPLCRDCFRRLG